MHVLSIRAARYPLGTHLNAALRRRDDGNGRCYPRRSRRRRRHPRFPAVGDCSPEILFFSLRSPVATLRPPSWRLAIREFLPRRAGGLRRRRHGHEPTGHTIHITPGLARESELARTRRAPARVCACVYAHVITPLRLRIYSLAQRTTPRRRHPDARRVRRTLDKMARVIVPQLRRQSAPGPARTPRRSKGRASGWGAGGGTRGLLPTSRCGA